MGETLKLSPDEIRRGFRGLTQPERDALLTRLNLPVSGPLPYRVGATKRELTSRADAEALQIWQRLGV